MYNHKNIPDLSGRVALVTGAGTGTGFGIAHHLASHGCKVIIASRTRSKLEDARDRLVAAIPGADIEVDTVDLTSLESIEAFAGRIREQYPRLDYLANNAGGGSPDYRNPDGLMEMTLAVNYLGHFALTAQLLPLLLDGSRIVNFSSMGYKRFLKNDLDVDNLICNDPADYDQMQEYCKGKLCMILMSLKLQERFEAVGSTSLSLSCHPGSARTNLMDNDDTPTMMRWFSRILWPITGVFGLSQSLYDGALPAVEALVTDAPRTDMVYSPSGWMEATGAPVPVEIDKTHYQESDIDALWVKTQELLGVDADQYLTPAA